MAVVPMLDLVAQYHSIQGEIDDAVHCVIGTGQFIGGPEVSSFEMEVAEYSGTKYAVSVASGTDALLLALLACGIGQGDEVITTPFTFIATAEAISRCGAVPVFADIDPVTYNINPETIESRITDRTKAILPVHLYGHASDMNPIMALARQHGIKVIEDCAQSMGTLHHGKSTGGIGDAGCLSFFPSKTLGAYGDGGMVITSDPSIADRVKLLKNHGSREKYHSVAHGFNSRLDSIQATILRIKLRHLRDWIRERQVRAHTYASLLGTVDGVSVPYVMKYSTHTFNYYTVRIDRSIGRNRLADFLSDNGISTAIYYPVALHLQDVYRDLGYRIGDFPYCEQAQDEVLSLPMYPELEVHQIELVVSKIKEFVARRVSER